LGGPGVDPREHRRCAPRVGLRGKFPRKGWGPPRGPGRSGRKTILVRFPPDGKPPRFRGRGLSGRFGEKGMPGGPGNRRARWLCGPVGGGATGLTHEHLRLAPGFTGIRGPTGRTCSATHTGPGGPQRTICGCPPRVGGDPRSKQACLKRVRHGGVFKSRAAWGPARPPVTRGQCPTPTIKAQIQGQFPEKEKKMDFMPKGGRGTTPQHTPGGASLGKRPRCGTSGGAGGFAQFCKEGGGAEWGPWAGPARAAPPGR